ncbi:hypothetical protein JB92DRAFT_2751628 [Gautieria morchelliformis]|nr:hypothetical protein JB92DRAFT_2751628 [Gautieria morchelliformis]
MNRGTLAVAVVSHEVVLVEAARSQSTQERIVDVFVFRHFGHRAFLADPSRPRTRIPAGDLLCVLPSADAARCPLTGMLELPKLAYGEYAECNKRHQNRVAHVWGAMPMRVSLR